MFVAGIVGVAIIGVAAHGDYSDYSDYHREHSRGGYGDSAARQAEQERKEKQRRELERLKSEFERTYEEGFERLKSEPELRSAMEALARKRGIDFTDSEDFDMAAWRKLLAEELEAKLAAELSKDKKRLQEIDDVLMKINELQLASTAQN